jgi:serine/threonine-protein kinase
MATVYKCHEAALERQVALKVLPKEFLHDETFAERFRREARTVANLEHPNIVPIHASGIEQGTPWMAMRFVSGGSLSSLIKERRLDHRQIVEVLRGVAEALDYAHSRGVVHRDVKPQNVLLDEAGRVYLADFGIAKIVESSSQLTQTGTITGTPQYMAPEQAKGGTIDYRADIYALGVVAYELLTGSPPFSADTPVGILLKHCSEPVPRPAATLVPGAATETLVKCLAKEPGDRWASASEFVTALEDGLFVSASVPTWSAPAPAGGTVTVRSPAPSPRRSTTMGVSPASHSTGTTARPATPRPAPPSAHRPAIVLGVAALIALLLTLAYSTATRPRPDPKRASASEDAGVPATLAAAPPARGALSPSSTLAPSNPTLALRTQAPAIQAPPATSSPSSPRAAESQPTPAAALAPPSAPPPSAPPVEPRHARLDGLLDFTPGPPLVLEARSGEVRASTIKFQVTEGRSGKFKRLIMKGGDIATVRAAVEVLRTPKAGDWSLVLRVELLDETGRTVAVFGDDLTIEDDRTVVNLEHEMSKSQLQLVRKARVRFEASPS